MHGGNLAAFVPGHRDDVGNVVFTLRIVVIELRQPAFQIRAVGDEDAGVDFVNLALLIAGIFMLNDPGDFSVLTGNAAIAGRVVELHG